MNALDILSNEPKNLIFAKSSNKNNLGGVFSLIYLIFVLIITSIYLYDYFANPKYIVSYTYQHQFKSDNKSIEGRYNNNSLNPNITFNWRLSRVKESSFELFCFNNKNKYSEIIKPNKDYNIKIYDLIFILFYYCSYDYDTGDYDCDIREEDKANYDIYSLIFNYSGFKLDHQNDDTPLNKDYYVQNEYSFYINDDDTD